MRQSRVHSCQYQEQVAMQKAEPKATKCKCRREVSYAEANDMFRRGEALWFVTKRERGKQTVDCRLCDGYEPSPSCHLCNGTGLVEAPAVWDTYNGDIVLVSHRTKSNRVSTPKVPTCESEHIERAYVDQVPAASQRIETYGEMVRESLACLGAEVVMRTGKKVIHIIDGRPEPANKVVAHPPGTITFRDGSKNKSWWWEVEGISNDYGRAI